MHSYVFFFEIGSFSILLNISIQIAVNSIGKQGLAIGNPLVKSVKSIWEKQNLYQETLVFYKGRDRVNLIL